MPKISLIFPFGPIIGWILIYSIPRFQVNKARFGQKVSNRIGGTGKGELGADRLLPQNPHKQ
jgi:hypothetical protein